MPELDAEHRNQMAEAAGRHYPEASQYGPNYCACSPRTGDWVLWTGDHVADALAPLVAGWIAEAWDAAVDSCHSHDWTHADDLALNPYRGGGDGCGGDS